MPKDKITSKEELEWLLDLIVFDDWLDTPICKTSEERKQYKESVRRKKMEIIKQKYDICIEDGEQ